MAGVHLLSHLNHKTFNKAVSSINHINADLSWKLEYDGLSKTRAAGKMSKLRAKRLVCPCQFAPDSVGADVAPQPAARLVFCLTAECRHESQRPLWGSERL